MKTRSVPWPGGWRTGLTHSGTAREVQDMLSTCGPFAVAARTSVSVVVCAMAGRGVTSVILLLADRALR